MILFWLFQLQLADNELQNVLERANGRMTSPEHCGPDHDQPKARDGKRRTDGHTATRRVGKILVVVSGKTVSEILKIHTFLISIFNPLFNKITNKFKL